MTLTEEVRARKALPAPHVAKLIRLSAGVSQERLAEELGVSRPTIGRWEAGARRPRGRLLLDYASVLAKLRDLE